MSKTDYFLISFGFFLSSTIDINWRHPLKNTEETESQHMKVKAIHIENYEVYLSLVI